MKVEKRSEHVPGYYYEPNKDYGSCTWVSDSWRDYWVIVTEDGFVSDRQYSSYQAAHAALAKLKKGKKK